MRSTATATSIVFVALASSSANAFVPIAHPVAANAPLHMSSVSSNYLDNTPAADSDNDVSTTADIPLTTAMQSTTIATDVTQSTPKMAKKPVAKKGGPAHKAGVFSPIVHAGKMVLGDDQLNKLRGKVISLHSNLIKDFVSTYDSAFGQAVLKSLFEVSDLDKDGKLSRDEVATALRSLGFEWLKDKQIDGIIKRADTDENGYICIDEFCAEAPRTLSTNLVKLAKKNGGDMGLLV
mmetsp:Transcript_19082/g.54997  ORF Transcript_19082/g.54997 Transcript_19082/m.54997 type:complete len:236 (+) Transcript_19082:163-870(+)